MKKNETSKEWSLLYRRGDAKKDAVIQKLAHDVGLSPIMATLLYNRGYRTAEEAVSFLNCETSILHDPFLMKDMKEAVERIRKSVENHDKISIYGDYDVDGVTSVSVLYLYLSSLGADVSYYIPSRNGEGYGLSCSAIDRLKEDGVKLIITVDTGITANEEAAYAASLGIDMVITDHHECRETLPDVCAVVNPHRPDCTYPFKELAGVGVVFKLVCAYETFLVRERGGQDSDAGRMVCYTYSDLVAIGTIADVMPVVDENRLIVTMGLRMISNTSRKGIAALIDASSGFTTVGNDSGMVRKKKKITSGFIGYTIAPRINAAGRISHATKAVELLLADSDKKAGFLAKELCEINTQRQVEENRIAEQVYHRIDSTHDFENDKVIVIDDDNWQQGIIGIVASRITERYGLPSILVSYDGSTRGYPSDDDIGKGSGRSVKGMNLVEALNYCEDILIRYGGHELAAGLTIERGKLNAFRQRINQYAAEKLGNSQIVVSLDADCEVEMEDLSMSLAKEIFKMEPFGIGNQNPTFVLNHAKITKIIPLGNGKHTKLIVEKDGISMSTVWFGMPFSQVSFVVSDYIDILFQLNINEYQSFQSLQMVVQDIRWSESEAELYRSEKKRYDDIYRGADFFEYENIMPTRNDFAFVYTFLKRKSRNGETHFTERALWTMLRASGMQLNYSKLKFILRVLQELNICGVVETAPGEFSFDVFFNTEKTSIDKSAILRKLRSQCKGNG